MIGFGSFAARMNSLMKYILLLIPVFGWGAIPLLTSGVKNSSVCNQIIGTGLGALIPALISLVIIRPRFDTGTFWLAIVAGILWAIGQLGQYLSFRRVGVSIAMPISTSFQLIGVPLVGTVVFNEWPSLISKVFGVFGITLLILGVMCTSKTSDSTNQNSKQKGLTKAIIILAITTWGYVISDSIPKAMTGSVFLIFVGQTIGIAAGAIIYTLGCKQIDAFKQKQSYQTIPGGISYGIAELSYIISVQQNGINLSFIISQLCVVVATVGGIIFLHERKTLKQGIYIAVGLVLIISGAALTII